MEKESSDLHSNEHNQAPSDAALRNKIDKHLNDIDDTISEEDIKNIKTGTGNKDAPVAPKADNTEKNNDDQAKADDIEPDKESPTAWEILGE